MSTSIIVNNETLGTNDMTGLVLQKLYEENNEEAKKLIEIVWSIHRDALTRLIDNYQKAKEEGRLSNAIDQGQTIIDYTSDWRGAWTQCRQQIQEEVDGMRMKIRPVYEEEEESKTAYHTPLTTPELTSDTDEDDFLAILQRRKGKLVPRRKVGRTRIAIQLKKLKEQKDRDEVSSTRANDEHEDTQWPASTNEPMPWDTCSKSLENAEEGQATHTTQAPLGWSTFMDREEAEKYGATVQSVGGTLYVTYTKEMEKRLNEDRWREMNKYPQVKLDHEFPADLRTPWEVTKPNEDDPRSKYWDLVSTNYDADVIDYNATRLEELNKKLAWSRTEQERWELQVLQAACEQYWLRKADNAAADHGAMARKCWTCDRRHDVGRCAAKKHILIASTEKSDRWVRNRMKYYVAGEMRRMQGRTGRKIEEWQQEWAEMLNYIENYRRD